MIRGDTPTIRLGPITRPDQDGNPQLVPLDGAAATLTARARPEDPETIFVLTNPEIDTARGLIDFRLPELHSNSLTLADHVYDIELREADGTVTTFPPRSPGRLTVLGDITRDAA